MAKTGPWARAGHATQLRPADTSRAEPMNVTPFLTIAMGLIETGRTVAGVKARLL
jgi:hypothetical protein